MLPGAICKLNATYRFFPAVFYLSTSKVAIAVLGNLAFAMALTLYNLTTKVGCGCSALCCFVQQLMTYESAGVSRYSKRIRGGKNKR